MALLTRADYLERVFHDSQENLKGKTLRLTRLRVPGKQVNMAHVLTPTDYSIYRNLGLDIGTHEGEDHSGETIGLISITPWESVIAAADVAMKTGRIEIGFMDRFSGSLIITGDLAEVESAVKNVVEFFRDDLGFAVCDIYRN